jgi:hypothetical protein
MDGPWQIGQKTAYEYGRAANEAAKVMKWMILHRSGCLWFLRLRHAYFWVVELEMLDLLL